MTRRSAMTMTWTEVWLHLTQLAADEMDRCSKARLRGEDDEQHWHQAEAAWMAMKLVEVTEVTKGAPSEDESLDAQRRRYRNDAQTYRTALVNIATAPCTSINELQGFAKRACQDVGWPVEKPNEKA